MMPDRDAEVRSILAALASGSFALIVHAKARMYDRGISKRDVQNLGRTPGRIEEQGRGKYRIDGEAVDQTPLTAIVVYVGETLVVTVF